MWVVVMRCYNCMTYWPGRPVYRVRGDEDVVGVSSPDIIASSSSLLSLLTSIPVAWARALLSTSNGFMGIASTGGSVGGSSGERTFLLLLVAVQEPPTSMLSSSAGGCGVAEGVAAEGCAVGC